MNTMEERLWSYIDGACSEEEREAIGLLIEQDTAYRSKYEELLSFSRELSKMELDEPSMAFTYKVMEGIRTEYAQQPLRATINPRIIKGLAAFFILSITLLVVFMFATVPVPHVNLSKDLSNNLKVPQGLDTYIKNHVNGSLLLQLFFLVDVVLALIFTDAWLRRKRQSKEALKP